MEEFSLEWDPEIDTPATIVVVGGGPAGIEAALYARFLGYVVVLFDSSRVGNSLLGCSDATILGSWGSATSSLGLAALAAQGVSDFSDVDAEVSCANFVEQYLAPVAQTDLLLDSIHLNAQVNSITRPDCPHGCECSPAERADFEFSVSVDSSVKGTFSLVADIILDCRGACVRPVEAGSDDELLLTAPEPNDVMTVEPHYYVLGQRAWGDERRSIADVRDQIKTVFGLIGGRRELNLYETVKPGC